MKNIFLKMMETGIFITGGIEDAIMRHANILNALRAHDVEKAAAAMEDHLVYSKKNVEQYLQNK
jgi:DNA-binding GntR family transcriptional regulator